MISFILLFNYELSISNVPLRLGSSHDDTSDVVDQLLTALIRIPLLHQVLYLRKFPQVKRFLIIESAFAYRIHDGSIDTIERVFFENIGAALVVLWSQLMQVLAIVSTVI